MWNSASAATAYSTSFAAAIDNGNSNIEVSSEEKVSGNLVISSNDKDDVSNEEEDIDNNDDLETVFFFATPRTSRTGRPGSSGWTPWRTTASTSYSGHAWRSSSMCGT